MEYTVVGLRPDAGGRLQRWAEAFSADTPAQAESSARSEVEELLVAGVVEGAQALQDVETYGDEGGRGGAAERRFEFSAFVIVKAPDEDAAKERAEELRGAVERMDVGSVSLDDGPPVELED